MYTNYIQELTELAKAKGIMPGSDTFNRIIANANDNLNRIKIRRGQHRFAKRGWAQGSHASLRSQSGMSVAEYLLLKDRYMPEEASREERIKLQEEMIRRHDHLRTYD